MQSSNNGNLILLNANNFNVKCRSLFFKISKYCGILSKCKARNYLRKQDVRQDGTSGSAMFVALIAVQQKRRRVLRTTLYGILKNNACRRRV